MPGPALWSGGSTASNSSSVEQNELATTSVPVATSAIATSAVATTAPTATQSSVAHNDKNCGPKLARTRRAFREMLVKH